MWLIRKWFIVPLYNLYFPINPTLIFLCTNQFLSRNNFRLLEAMWIIINDSTYSTYYVDYIDCSVLFLFVLFVSFASFTNEIKCFIFYLFLLSAFFAVVVVLHLFSALYYFVLYEFSFLLINESFCFIWKISTQNNIRNETINFHYLFSWKERVHELDRQIHLYVPYKYIQSTKHQLFNMFVVVAKYVQVYSHCLMYKLKIAKLSLSKIPCLQLNPFADSLRKYLVYLIGFSFSTTGYVKQRHFVCLVGF